MLFFIGSTGCFFIVSYTLPYTYCYPCTLLVTAADITEQLDTTEDVVRKAVLLKILLCVFITIPLKKILTPSPTANLYLS